MLWGDHHAREPSNRGVWGNLFDHLEFHVSVEASLDLVVPVEGGRGRSVAGDRLCVRRDVQLERWAPLHHWQGLHFAGIEGRGLELVN